MFNYSKLKKFTFNREVIGSTRVFVYDMPMI